MEKLRTEKEVHQLKVEVLRQEKIEAERKAQQQRQEEEQLWLEAKAKEKELALEREKQEAVEHQQLADLKEQEEKEKEDEANEMALQAAGALSVSDGDSEVDPADPKTATMAELRKRHRIAKGKKKTDAPESWKCKIWSASRVEKSEDKVRGCIGGSVDT